VPTLSLQGRNKNIVLLSCGLVCCLFLYTISSALPYVPEPIGSRAGMFISGSKITLLLSLGSGFIGLIIGIAVGLGKLNRNFLLANFCQGFVWILRLLTQILFVYYVLPKWLPALKLNEFTSALIALALNVAAYNAEVIRGAVLSIAKTQTEAGLALGLSRFAIMRHIIFPQAFKVSSPALINNFIALIKDSSLASSIGLLELSLAGTRISSETFDPLPVLVTVSVIYLSLTSLISIVQYYYNLKH
jgi:polar amino acid transport system permease protein